MLRQFSKLKKQLKYFYIVILSFCFLGVACGSDETKYFTLVNQTGGSLTRELHQQFWDIMTIKYDADLRAQISQQVLQDLELLREFQVKTWESAHISYYAKTFQKVEGFDSAELNL